MQKKHSNSSTIWFLFSINVIGVGIPLAVAGEPSRKIVTGNFPNQTDAAIDAEGRIHVAYGVEKENLVYYRMLPAGEGSPSPPANINGQSEVIVRHERGPKIALDNQGGIYVVWQTTDRMVCVHSANGGIRARFEPINVVDHDGSIDMPNIGNDESGTVYAIWVDHRHHTEDPLGAELYMSRTDEQGHFGKNVQISDDQFPVCPCCMPEIQCSGKMIYVLYRSTKMGIKEMILRRADREKLDWTTTMIGKDNWKFEGCPMSGGHLAASQKKVVAAWMSDGKYYVAASENQGKSFSSQREIPSVRQLPLPTLDSLFSERGPLELKNLKSKKDDAAKLNGKVISIAWQGTEKDAPCLIVQSKMIP